MPPTLLDIHEILKSLDDERRRLKRYGEIVEVLPCLTRIRADDNSHHSVVYSSLTVETADEAIEREIGHYRLLGVEFEWKLFSHDLPTDLLNRLQCHGFRIGQREAVMVYDLKNTADWMNETSTKSVIRIEDAERISDYRKVAEAVFEKNYEFTSNQLAAALEACSMQHRGYVAYAESDPVSIGRLYTHPESVFAGLYGGGTLPAYRGQGFYRALVATRARDAIELGAKYLTVDAMPSSLPILERMGFERIADTWPCVWSQSV